MAQLDRIDILIPYGKSKLKMVVNQIREICAILSGLVLAADYKTGQKLFGAYRLLLKLPRLTPHL